MELSKKPLSAPARTGNFSGGNGVPYTVQLLEKARADSDTVLKELGSQLSGLSEVEADARFKQVGTNEIAREKRQSDLMRLLGNVKNPLVLLLVALLPRGVQEKPPAQKAVPARTKPTTRWTPTRMEKYPRRKR